MTHDTLGAVYAQGRERICELAETLSDDEAATMVPGCPEWSVADVLAHLSGISVDVLAGNIEGVATPPWTAAQVEARRGMPLKHVIAEWREHGPRVEALAAQLPEFLALRWLTDLATHEHDIRGAVNRPGARDAETVRVAMDGLLSRGLDAGVRERGLPPLQVHADPHRWVAGDEEQRGGGVLRAPAFELFRALTGRRSHRQIRAFDWSVDPEPYLPAFTFGPFSTTPEDIIE